MGFEDAVVVLRTGHLHELTLALDSLKAGGVPCYSEQEVGGGVRLAMPISPVMGPGRVFNVVVPKSHLGEAERIMMSLPFAPKTEVEPWDFSPKPQVKGPWIAYNRLVLLVIVIGMATTLLGWISSLVFR